MTAPDPTAGERECRYPCGCGQFPDEHCACMDGHAPPAVAASTGTSEDAEALARLTYEEREAIGWGLDYGTVLQEVERIITTREAAARAEERERIAQAIEALPQDDHVVGYQDACDDAAQIAREAR